MSKEALQTNLSGISNADYSQLFLTTLRRFYHACQDYKAKIEAHVDDDGYSYAIATGDVIKTAVEVRRFATPRLQELMDKYRVPCERGDWIGGFLTELHGATFSGAGLMGDGSSADKSVVGALCGWAALRLWAAITLQDAISVDSDLVMQKTPTALQPEPAKKRGRPKSPEKAKAIEICRRCRNATPQLSWKETCKKVNEELKKETDKYEQKTLARYFSEEKKRID